MHASVTLPDENTLRLVSGSREIWMNASGLSLRSDQTDKRSIVMQLTFRVITEGSEWAHVHRRAVGSAAS